MEEFKRKVSESAGMRWAILILVGFVLSVNYYFYDAFSTLKDLLMSEFNYSNTDYGLFISFYSIPNTFLLMAVLGGIILDRYGIRRTGFLFVFFMAFGALLTAYGASDYYREGGFAHALFSSFLTGYSPELKMMLLGRFFFGLGAETSIVVVSKILVKWFKGKDLALAFGLKVGFGRLGTFAALQLSPRLAESAQLSTAIWFAAVLVLAGLLAFMVYMLLDIRYDREVAQTTEPEKKDAFKISDIGKILSNPAYLYIALLCVTFYSAVFPFLAFAPDLFLNKFGMTSVQSGEITSLLPLGTLIFTPLFGFLIDRYGKAATAMIFGSSILLLIHLNFAFTDLPPHIPMILMGISFSLVPAAMWPTMVRLVEDKQIGTAYGLMYSIQNLGLFAFPILSGTILDNTNPGNPDVLNYTPTMLMFAGLGLLGVVFAVLLKVEDKRKGFGVDLAMNRE
ncbi:MAG: MFS transporter [Bacteroidales bacterium]|jgi:nitrate/nitrite transporter NarK|nr:MFS transporter [Bacteroidales bacterium]